VLQDNYYSFAYRKVQCEYYINFYDFNTAETVIRSILKDELDFYGVRNKLKEEEKN
jgi:hypothetical protein